MASAPLQFLHFSSQSLLSPFAGENTLIHQCCIASSFCPLHCFVMPISLLTELQIPVLVSNQSFFISGQAVCRNREPLQQSCLHSLRKGGTVEHPSPASSPGCALKCRSSKSLEIKGVFRLLEAVQQPSPAE